MSERPARVRAVLRSRAPGVIAQVEVAKRGEYISAFANLYIEMIAEVP